jgi:hypothetical protein
VKAPRPFIVEKRALAPKPRAAEVVVVVDQAKDEEKKRDRRIKALAANAFRNWRPGF